MTTAAVLPVPIQQYFDNAGLPLAGGQLYTYEHGASVLTPMAMYTDVLLTIPFTNPIVLDSSGRTTGPMFPLPSPAYDFVMKDANGATVWTANNIIAVLGAD